MVVPGMPTITYDPSREVYDGSLLRLSCKSDTQDAKDTEVIWIRSNDRVDGETTSDSSSVVNTIIIPAVLSDSGSRYECHVIHPNLPEPLISYANFTGEL